MYVSSRRTPYDRPSRRFDQDGGDRDYMKRLGLPVGGGDSYSQKDQWYRIIVSTCTLLPVCYNKATYFIAMSFQALFINSIFIF